MDSLQQLKADETPAFNQFNVLSLYFFKVSFHDSLAVFTNLAIVLKKSHSAFI